MLFLLAFLMGLAMVQSSAAAEPLNVYTVNYPLTYFAERIGGEHVKVTFPAPADIDPAYWTPEVATIAGYQQADLILLNGAAYAKWVQKVSLPRSRMVNTSKKFKDRYIPVDGAVTHSHGPTGEHAHGEVAFTTWLDLRLAVRQAEAVAQAFARKLPQHRDVLRRNFSLLKSDLTALDSALRETVGRAPAKPLVASHPVYDYLVRGYGLHIKSVHWEPDETPSSRQWLELHRLLQEHPAEWMIWEGQPAGDSVEKLRSTGIDSLVFVPCANRPKEGDFLSVMRRNIEELQKAYSN